jgi:hypothetical protein
LVIACVSSLRQPGFNKVATEKVRDFLHLEFSQGRYA